MSGFVFVALDDCGCQSGGIVDEYPFEREAAEFIFGWLDRGATIKRLPQDEADDLVPAALCKHAFRGRPLRRATGLFL